MPFRPGSEDEAHHAILEWLRWCVPGVEVIHVPNGFYAGDDADDPSRKKVKAHIARLKALGMRPGAHDLLCFVPGPRVFWIEVKPAKGKLSDVQIEFGAAMEALGVPWRLCRSSEDARDFVEGMGIETREAKTTVTVMRLEG